MARDPQELPALPPPPAGHVSVAATATLGQNVPVDALVVLSLGCMGLFPAPAAYGALVTWRLTAAPSGTAHGWTTGRMARLGWVMACLGTAAAPLLLSVEPWLAALVMLLGWLSWTVPLARHLGSLVRPDSDEGVGVRRMCAALTGAASVHAMSWSGLVAPLPWSALALCLALGSALTGVAVAFWGLEVVRRLWTPSDQHLSVVLPRHRILDQLAVSVPAGFVWTGVHGGRTWRLAVNLAVHPTTYRIDVAAPRLRGVAVRRADGSGKGARLSDPILATAVRVDGLDDAAADAWLADLHERILPFVHGRRGILHAGALSMIAFGPNLRHEAIGVLEHALRETVALADTLEGRRSELSSRRAPRLRDQRATS